MNARAKDVEIEDSLVVQSLKHRILSFEDHRRTQNPPREIMVQLRDLRKSGRLRIAIMCRQPLSNHSSGRISMKAIEPGRFPRR
jgi:hypothetical protein